VSESVSFVLKGNDRGSDLVRAGDFVMFVQRLIACLAAVDEALNDKPAHYLRLAELRTSSAAGTVEPVVQPTKWERRHTFLPLVEPFGELLSAAKNRSVAPAWATLDVLQKIRELSETPKHVASAELTAGGVQVQIDDEFRGAIDEFIGGEVQSVGSVTGWLDGLNVHSSNLAYLYPGDGTSIACEFADSALGAVKAALKKRVRIAGLLTRRLNSNRPVRVRILELEELPPNSDLPLFSSLVGLSPEATGGMSSEDYLARLREGDE
jgi:hypothetical protein